MKRLTLMTFAAVLALAIGAIVTASRDSSGTYTLPSGNPVVSGTTISSTVHNNTMNDLKTEMTDSLSRSGKGGMTAPLRCADGAVGAPAFSWTSDTDTGLYRIGANNPAMSAGGVKVQEWSATTATFPLAVAVTGAQTNAAGITVTQSTSNGNAVTATGNGTGAGVRGVGQTSTAGPGGDFEGGTSAGNGVKGKGYTTAAGVYGLNGSAANADDNDSPGIIAAEGHLKLSGGNPTSTVSFTNYLTAMNIPKAWANVDCNATATPAILAGFNVTSAGAASAPNRITVTWATAFANANYIVSATALGAASSGLVATLIATTTTTAVFELVDNAGTVFDCDSDTAAQLMVVAYGAQ